MSNENSPQGLPITWILMGGIGGIVFAALAVTFWLGFSVAADNTTILLRQRATTLIDDVTTEVRRHLQPAADHARFAADTIARHGSKPDDAAISQLISAMALAPHLRDAAYMDVDGSWVRYTREGQITHESWVGDRDATELMEAMSGTTAVHWLAPIYVEQLRETIIPALVPVHHDGVFMGIAAAAVTIHELSRFTATLDVPGGAAFVLLGRNQVVAHEILVDGLLDGFFSDSTPLLNTVQTGDKVLQAFREDPGEELFILDDVETDLGGGYYELDGAGYVLLFREISDFGDVPWIVGSYIQPSKISESQALRRLQISAGFSIAFMAVTLFVLYWIARRIRRPILELAGASDRVRNLDFGEIDPAKPSFVRELNEAGEAFRHMLEGLRLFETYVPKSLVLRLLSTRGAGRVRSDERIVTLMFTDIAGFTSMAERMTAADTAELLNQHFTLLNAHVERHGGTVDKYIGDSMMAFWGAPDAQPDHAARGCQAVLDIAADLRADNAKRAIRGEAPLRMRIGLHSGPAIAGDIGAPGRVNYTVVGDTVNTANRLEQLGKEVAPNADVVILVSGETAALAGAEFSLAKVGAFTLRGRESALTVYRLEQPDA